MLCLEGLAHSLRVYLGLEKPANFRLTKPQNPIQFIVDKSVENVRRYACSAILRDITFTEDSLKSFIDLQDKLHQNICRNRTLVTMGTHDLDTVKGPIYLKAKKPEEIVFKALKREELTNGHQLLEVLKNDLKLKKYTYLLDGLETYPVLLDSADTVLALPPLINSEHSKITVNTKNILIDVTAHDLTKATIVLNMLVTAFSVYCKDKYTVEPVEVIDLTGEKIVYPKLDYVEFVADVDYMRNLVGCVDLKIEQIIELLSKMSLICSKLNESQIKVIVPPTRSDIIHQCDIAEDLAIAYGYDNIKKTKLTTVCNGKQQPINKLTEIFRQEMAFSGFTETLTFALVSKKDAISNMLGKESDLDNFVQIYKAKTQEFEIFRTSLIPGLLKIVEKNIVQQLPIKVFEISDVCLLDEQTETGAKNRRKLAFAYVNNTSALETVQGVLDHILGNKLNMEYNKRYTTKPSNDLRFFPDRQANLEVDGVQIGIFGVLNPEINKKFDIPFPVTIAEIDIEFLYELILNKNI